MLGRTGFDRAMLQHLAEKERKADYASPLHAQNEGFMAHNQPRDVNAPGAEPWNERLAREYHEAEAASKPARGDTFSDAVQGPDSYPEPHGMAAGMFTRGPLNQGHETPSPANARKSLTKDYDYDFRDNGATVTDPSGGEGGGVRHVSFDAESAPVSAPVPDGVFHPGDFDRGLITAGHEAASPGGPPALSSPLARAAGRGPRLSRPDFTGAARDLPC